MANKYWVTGGTGNWNSTTNWSLLSGGVSGAPVPSTIDAVILDASSGAGSVTLDISPDIQRLTMTGFTGTLAFGTNTISLNDIGTIFTGATTMTVTGTPQIICTYTGASGRTITPGAVTEANSISFRITAGTGTLSLPAGSYRNLDFTDGVNPTGYAGALGNAVQTIYGNFKASTGMTRTPGTSGPAFAATSGTKTIDTAGVTFDCPFTFNGVGGTWQLQGALTSGATRTCTLTNGTLDLVSYTLTTGIFSSSNSNTRVLAFGTGKIVVTGNNTTVCTTNTGTALTVTGSKRVELSYSGSTGTRTIQGATNATVIEGTNLLDYYVISGGDTVTFTSSRAYGTIDFYNAGASTFTGTFTNSTLGVYGDLAVKSGMTINSGTLVTSLLATSGTKTITSNGQTLDFPITINAPGATVAMQDALTLGSTRALTMTDGTLQLAAGTTNTVGSFVTTGTTPKYLLSTTPGTQATISDASGTNTVTYLTVQDSIATGGATWDALAITNVDAGNNTGWLFSTTPSIGNEITMRLRSFTQPRRF